MSSRIKNPNNQIARIIYLSELDTMKKILNLAEFKFDRRTKEYQYFKSQIMDNFYNNLNKLFKELEQLNLIQKSTCKHSVRGGYKACLCGGSGYINKEK